MMELFAKRATHSGAVLRGLFWTGAGDLAAKGAVLTTGLVAIRTLTPSVFGTYVGLSAVALLAAGVWDLGVSPLLTRECASGRLSGYSAIAQASHLRLWTLPLWLSTYALGALAVGRLGHASWLALLFFGLASLQFSLHSIALSLLRARLRFKVAGLVLSSGRWTTALVSFAAAFTSTGDHALELFAGAIAAGELVTLVAAAGALRADGALRAGGHAHLSLRSAFPFAANGILSMAYNRLDVVILATLSTSDQLGSYAPASRLQDALYLVSSSLWAVAFPMIARLSNESRDRSAARSSVVWFVAIGLGITVPAAVLLTVYAGSLVSVVLGPEYSHAVAPVRILIWSMPLAAVGAPMLAFLAGTGRASDTTLAFLAAFAVSITLHLALDSTWGARGGAIASLTRDAANVAVLCLLMLRTGQTSEQRAAHADIGIDESPSASLAGL